MKTMKTFETRAKKECQECGNEIKEQRESIVYECERCMGQRAE
ncbi:protein YhfH [Planococcus salinus]|uniref:YhfH family protein n=1 Tax=Planococcus salinus TaxID=1848460 RepID=A0A3M8P4Q8_9BACL|nr:protein YhfH [Planococcus salinus]RNF38381.1 YhfH family protein [Planococcus salinus]